MTELLRPNGVLVLLALGVSGLALSPPASAGLVPSELVSYEPFWVGQVRRDVVAFGCPLSSTNAAIRIARRFSGLSRDLDDVFSIQAKYDAFLKETRCGAVSSDASRVVEILFKADQSRRDDEAVTDRNGISRSPTQGLSLILMEDVASRGRYLALVDAEVEGDASRPELVMEALENHGSARTGRPDERGGGGAVLALSPGDLCDGLERLIRESQSGFAGVKGPLDRSEGSSEHYSPGFDLLPDGKCGLVHYLRSDRWTYACRFRIESDSEQDGLDIHRRLVRHIKRCLGGEWTESAGPAGPFSIASTSFARDTTTVVANLFSVLSSLVTVHLSVEAKVTGREQARRRR